MRRVVARMAPRNSHLPVLPRVVGALQINHTDPAEDLYSLAVRSRLLERAKDVPVRSVVQSRPAKVLGIGVRKLIDRLMKVEARTLTEEQIDSMLAEAATAPQYVTPAHQEAGSLVFKRSDNIEQFKIPKPLAGIDDIRLALEVYHNRHKLQEVRLANCGIGDAAGKIIAAAIAAPDSIIKIIDLGHNNLSDESAVEVVRAAKSKDIVQELRLGNNRLGRESAVEVIDLIASNLPMTTLDVGYNKMFRGVIAKWLMPLPDSLDKLVFGVDFRKLLRSALEKNHNLRDLVLDPSYENEKDDLEKLLSGGSRLQITIEKYSGDCRGSTPGVYIQGTESDATKRLIADYASVPVARAARTKHPQRLEDIDTLRYMLFHEAVDHTRKVMFDGLTKEDISKFAAHHSSPLGMVKRGAFRTYEGIDWGGTVPIF